MPVTEFTPLPWCTVQVWGDVKTAGRADQSAETLVATMIPNLILMESCIGGPLQHASMALASNPLVAG